MKTFARLPYTYVMSCRQTMMRLLGKGETDQRDPQLRHDLLSPQATTAQIKSHHQGPASPLSRVDHGPGIATGQGHGLLHQYVQVTCQSGQRRLDMRLVEHIAPVGVSGLDVE